METGAAAILKKRFSNLVKSPFERCLAELDTASQGLKACPSRL